MRVAVNQARRDPTTFAVNDLGTHRRNRHVLFGACIDNTTIARHDGAMLDFTKTGSIFSQRRQARIAPDAACPCPAFLLLSHSLFPLHSVEIMYIHIKTRRKC